MKNRILRVIMLLGATTCTFFALSTSVSACTLCFYQPKEPKCLREE